MFTMKVVGLAFTRINGVLAMLFPDNHPRARSFEQGMY